VKQAFVFFVVVAACSSRRESAPVRQEITDAPAKKEACTRQPFADDVPVPEASGAVVTAIDGKPAVVIVGDSGTRGAYAIVDPDTGAEIETGHLPLGSGASDDLEGLAVRGDRIAAITSSGWIREWTRAGGAFELAAGPYPVAADGSELVCAPNGVNCGKNYEGLCTDPTATEGCVGYAASKADGKLYCLTLAGGKLAGDARAIDVAPRETLTGCDIAPDGTLWTGQNLFGGSRVHRVTDWRDPATAKVVEVGAFGVGFPEAIAVGPGNTLYRFSDLADRAGPSAASKFGCTPVVQ
jgi:hypothetical protein